MKLSASQVLHQEAQKLITMVLPCNFERVKVSPSKDASEKSGILSPMAKRCTCDFFIQEPIMTIIPTTTRPITINKTGLPFDVFSDLLELVAMVFVFQITLDLIDVICKIGGNFIF